MVLPLMVTYAIFKEGVWVVLLAHVEKFVLAWVAFIQKSFYFLPIVSPEGCATCGWETHDYDPILANVREINIPSIFQKAPPRVTYYSL